MISPITTNSSTSSPITINPKGEKCRDESNGNGFSMFATSNVGAVDVSEVTFSSSAEGKGVWPRCLGASSVATREAALDRECADWAGAGSAGGGVRTGTAPLRRMGS